MKQQPTIRQINSHVFAGTGYCYVSTPEGLRFRISLARTRKGVVEGRVINGNMHTLKDWEVIPANATIELS